MKNKSAGSVRNALGWSFFTNLSDKGLGLLVKLVLARLLVPEAFGVIGMAIVFVSFLNVVSEMGMTAALIQRPESDLRQEHWSTAFSISLATAVAGWVLICVLLSPFIVRFYSEPALKLVLPALGFSLVIDSLAIVQRARLRKKLKFKSLSIASISSTLLASAVAVGMALGGMGVWALVAKTLLGSTARTSIMWIMLPWRPSIAFDKEAFQDIFGFSGYVALERLMSFFTSNLDYILIGKLLGSGALGIYTLAFTLTDTFRLYIMSTFNAVLFPVYSRWQDDKKKTGAYYLKVVRFNSLLIMPLMTILALNAGPIILHFFGDKWIATILPLRLLALSVIVHAFGGTAASLIRGAGYARLMTGISFFRTFFVTAPAIAIGAAWWGIDGVAWAVLIYKIIGRNITQHFIKKLFGIRESDIFRAAAPAILSCLGMGLLHHYILAPFFKESSLMMLCIRLLAEMLLFGLMLVPVFLTFIFPEKKIHS
ncbi:MAG: lipopolysaccharide biosynthesis protein [Proteobacteria bacterium]|nr:lipopolysaccharide biosynthesis protein [Pseudomonadota bacterium]